MFGTNSVRVANSTDHLGCLQIVNGGVQNRPLADREHPPAPCPPRVSGPFAGFGYPPIWNVIVIRGTARELLPVAPASGAAA
jgi:hypothetical protein